MVLFFSRDAHTDGTLSLCLPNKKECSFNSGNSQDEHKRWPENSQGSPVILLVLPSRLLLYSVVTSWGTMALGKLSLTRRKQVSISLSEGENNGREPLQDYNSPSKYAFPM